LWTFESVNVTKAVTIFVPKEQTSPMLHISDARLDRSVSDVLSLAGVAATYSSGFASLP
jgi:hypothetical protein